MAELADPLLLLDWAKDLGRTCPFLDFHTHPFNVLTDDTEYQPCQGVEGLFAKALVAYRSPSCMGATELRRFLDGQGGAISERALLLASRFAYLHTGSKVFLDQLGLAGIAGAVLLPVARTPGAAQRLLEASARMFRNENRLLLGCPFPVGIPPDAIASFFRSARKTDGIRAIKIHANLAGIDPLTSRGRDLIEAALAAAGGLGLPVIVHGGRTPFLEPVEAGEFGTLSRLAEVDWSLSAAPVIIAHAGCYGLEEGEIAASVSALEKLFDRHPNLLADTSALAHGALREVLLKTDRSRLVFGSDALYQPIWKGWLAFLHALRQASSNPDDDLVRIASKNPARCLAAADGFRDL